MTSLSLADIAEMSYEEFQKIIDEEGKISSFQWFKNANLFYGLQDEIRNLIVEQEAL